MEICLHNLPCRVRVMQQARAVAATRRDIPEVVGGVTFDCAAPNMSPPRSNNASDTNGVMGEDAQPTTIDWHQQLAAGAG